MKSTIQFCATLVIDVSDHHYIVQMVQQVECLRTSKKNLRARYTPLSWLVCSFLIMCLHMHLVPLWHHIAPQLVREATVSMVNFSLMGYCSKTDLFVGKAVHFQQVRACVPPNEIILLKVTEFQWAQGDYCSCSYSCHLQYELVPHIATCLNPSISKRLVMSAKYWLTGWPAF